MKKTTKKIPAGKDKKPIKPKKPMKGEKKMKAGSVVVTVVVDESGSMDHLRDSTISGFNEYVDGLKRSLAGERVYFSALTFDSKGVRKLQVGAAIKDAMHLNYDNYKPDQSTPLNDAFGAAITATDAVMAQQDGTKAIVMIQTDGGENASTKYTLPQIQTMVADRTAKGWQFVFIGAGIDAFAAGTRYGVMAGSTMSYGANDVNTAAVFRSTAANTRAYASGASQNMMYSTIDSMCAGESAEIQLKKAKAAQVTPSAAIDALNITGSQA